MKNELKRQRTYMFDYGSNQSENRRFTCPLEPELAKDNVNSVSFIMFPFDNTAKTIILTNTFISRC